MELIINSPLFGIFLTIITFIIGYEIQVKMGLKFLSPMVTSSVLIIAILLIFKIPYSNYKKGADILTFFVAPATVVLAVPLYKNLDIIKKYFLPILLGCLVGIGVGAITGIVLCNIFGINKEILLSMLPKSVTSAIGYEISKKIGAIMEISMVFIVICGIIGYSVGELIFKIFKTVGPITLVKIPVATTTTNVTVVSPCILSVIPTAIAVVTDLGKSEIAKKKSIPKALATRAVKLVFTTTAIKVPSKMLLAWCFMR